MACRSNDIDVYVKLPSGKVLSFFLGPHERVAEIYQRVAADLQAPVGQVNVKYTGKLLHKTATISGLGICRETILKAELLRIRHLTVFVKQTGLEPLAVPVDNIDDVTTLRQRIGLLLEKDCDAYILKLPSDEKIQGNARLLDLGVEDGMQLTLQEKSSLASAATSELEKEDIIDEQTQEQVVSSFDAAGRVVEVVFSFDTTGSMYSCLVEVRAKLCDTVERLLRDIPNIRIGIIAHGDYCDYSTYVLKQHDLCKDPKQLTDFVNQVPSTSGGDSPECYEWVLRKAQMFDWSEDSAKALVIIGDDVPHTVCYTDLNINWHQELDLLCAMGVKVYGVHKNGSARMSRQFYQELAERSGGAYLKLSNFKLITDMFLAVCYKESSSQQFEEFCEEVKDEGRMSEDTQQMFMNLQDMPKTPPVEKPDRYVAESWWDASLASGSPQFTYSPEHDSWKPWSQRHSNAGPEVDEKFAMSTPKARASSPANKNASVTSKRKIKDKCSIM